MSTSCHRRTFLKIFTAGLLGASLSPLSAAEGPVRERIREKLAEKSSGGTTGSHTFEHRGGQRTYELHLPNGSKPSKPLPLVVVLHGMGGNGAITAGLTQFNPIADKNNFAVLYPDGLNRMWRYFGDEDTSFVLALIDALIKDGTVDRARIYVCGISNGAYLTNVLVCDHGDRFAAGAAVAGTFAKLKAAEAKPTRPMPLLYIHGTADKIVSIDGKDVFSKREMSLSAEDYIHWWVKHNGCTEKPVAEKVPDLAADDTTAERFTYKSPAGNADVIFYKVTGGGHTWPGGSVQPEAMLGKTSRDFNASEAMWEFFHQHQLPLK